MSSRPPYKKSKQQQEEETLTNISGYVHNVSPIKIATNNSKYFDATFQTDKDEYRRTIVFSAEKHVSFVQAAEKATLIQLTHVRKILSFVDKDGFDIKVTRGSTLQVTELPFRCKQRNNKVSSVAELKNLGPAQQVPMLTSKSVQ